jgi:CDP-glucose 4,6-dehydratase
VNIAAGDATKSAFWSGRVVLLTGATGFLGGALADRLLSAGASVVAVVRRHRPGSRFYAEALDRRVTLEHGDVSDADFMRAVFDRHDLTTVFHTAYGADVNAVLREPLECFRGNVQSTWLLLDLVRTTKPECTTVVSSSDKAYGTQALPLREDKPLAPLHPYEVAKASEDLVAQSYGKVYGLPVGVTRCGNFFGSYDLNATRLIPGTLEMLARGERPVLRSDGRSTRDFLYVEDAADAQMLLAEHLSSRPELYGEAFNFSYGLQLEVLEVVGRVMALAGREDAPIIDATTQSEIPHLHLSSDKAQQLLGWQPATGFDEGLARTVRWYLQHFSDQERSDVSS